MAAGLFSTDLRRYLALSPREQLGWATALGALLVVRLGLAVTSLERLAAGLGVRVCRGSAKASYCQAPEIKATASRVGVLLARWPSRSRCLVGALAAGYLLRQYQPTLFIGVRRKGEHIIAHAWLDVESGRVPLNLPDDSFDFVLLRRSRRT
jgi:hypothetical protein